MADENQELSPHERRLLADIARAQRTQNRFDQSQVNSQPSNPGSSSIAPSYIRGGEYGTGGYAQTQNAGLAAAIARALSRGTDISPKLRRVQSEAAFALQEQSDLERELLRTKAGLGTDGERRAPTLAPPLKRGGGRFLNLAKDRPMNRPTPQPSYGQESQIRQAAMDAIMQYLRMDNPHLMSSLPDYRKFDRTR